MVSFIFHRNSSTTLESIRSRVYFLIEITELAKDDRVAELLGLTMTDFPILD